MLWNCTRVALPLHWYLIPQVDESSDNGDTGVLLTQFEFIFVLVSIVLGLGLANLFGGISRQLQQSWREIEGVYLAFAFGVVLAIFVVWWGMYRWQAYGQFEFGTFVVIATYTSVFYAMSVVLYPRDVSIRSFDQIRKPFFITLILYGILEIPYYQAGGFVRAEFYWYTWFFLLVLCLAAVFVKRKLLDLSLAVFWFGVWSVWWFVTKLSE